MQCTDRIRTEKCLYDVFSDRISFSNGTDREDVFSDHISLSILDNPLARGSNRQFYCTGVIIYNKLDNHFFVFADREIFLGF